MGNVHAASPKLEPETLTPNPPMGFHLPPLQPEIPPSKSSNSNTIENPGSIEELHKKCKGQYRLFYCSSREVIISGSNYTLCGASCRCVSYAIRGRPINRK